MARKTKEDALVTRDRILDAAELVFEQRGVSRCSLQEIAQAAGVTRGAIYWHFENKADLVNAMLQRVALPLEEAISRSADPNTADPVLEVRNSLLNALRKTVACPQVQRVFVIKMQKLEYVDELQAVRDKRINTRVGLIDQVAIGLKRATAQGQLDRRLPARASAIALHALVSGLIENWLLDPSAFDLVQVGEQALDTYLAGLSLHRPMPPDSKPTRART
ncbi:MAG: TetR family transcriptional regulator [Burkholderiales bacterium PBB1]|nr:MAG: TetR family transcriptional regulator [Burkholderiales bacterium PBB1]